MDSTASYPAIVRLRRAVPPTALAPLIGPPVVVLIGPPVARPVAPLIGPPVAPLIGPPVAPLIGPPTAGHRLLRRPRDGCHSLAAWSRRSRVASSPGPR